MVFTRARSKPLAISGKIQQCPFTRKYCHLCLNDFETLQNLGFITQYSNIKQGKSRFILSIPRHEIQQYTGNNELEGSSLHGCERFDTSKKPKKEISGAKISNNLGYKKLPSVVPSTTKLNTKNTNFEKIKC